MKLSPKRICTKEKVFRLVIGLFILFLLGILPMVNFVARYVFGFLGVYLLITALMGSCLIYSIWKE